MIRQFFVIILLTASLATSLNVPALSSDKANAIKTKKTEAIRQKVYEKLKLIQDQVEKKQYTSALEFLRTLREEKLSDYELSQNWNLEAYTHYLRSHYEQAITAYQHVLDYDHLPVGIVQSSLKTISQLYFTIGDYPSALKTVTQLMQVAIDPSADTHILLGQIYYQMSNFSKALTPIERGIQKYESQGMKAKENWLLLLRAIYHEQKQYKQMVPVLKKLILLYPKNTYVLTLANIYSQLGDSKKQLSLIQPLYETGAITKEAVLVNLANLYLLHEQPYKAAQLLQHETIAGRVTSSKRVLRLMAQAWQMAREDEQALQPMERAANLSKDGNLYIRLAQSYLNLGRWEKAEQVINKALAKGKLNRVGDAQIMLGMAQLKQRKLQLARSNFKKAGGYKKSSKSADQWLVYVDSEIQRQALQEQKKPIYYRRKNAQKM